MYEIINSNLKLPKNFKLLHDAKNLTLYLMYCPDNKDPLDGEVVEKFNVPSIVIEEIEKVAKSYKPDQNNLKPGK